MMTKKTKKAWSRVAVLGAALTISASAAGVASADSAFDQLTLSVTPTNDGAGKQVTLLCEPPGGNHPDAAAACGDLLAARGNIAAIPPQTGMFCPAIFMPVTAKANGWWQGRPVSYSRTFSNACVANVQTGGHVFHF